jgi:hypothetical protein
MFPLLILVAYAADRGFCCNKNKTSSEVEIAFGESPVLGFILIKNESKKGSNSHYT